MRKKDELLDAIFDSLLRKNHLFGLRRADIADYAEAAARNAASHGDGRLTNVDILQKIMNEDSAYQALLDHLLEKQAEEYA